LFQVGQKANISGDKWLSSMMSIKKIQKYRDEKPEIFGLMFHRHIPRDEVFETEEEVSGKQSHNTNDEDDNIVEIFEKITKDEDIQYTPFDE